MGTWLQGRTKTLESPLLPICTYIAFGVFTKKKTHPTVILQIRRHNNSLPSCIHKILYVYYYTETHSTRAIIFVPAAINALYYASRYSEKYSVSQAVEMRAIREREQQNKILL